MPATPDHQSASPQQQEALPPSLTLDRPGAPARRMAALRGTPRKAGYDRSQYPPAMFAEGGEGADVRYISRRDSRSAGAMIGLALRRAPNGAHVVIEVTP